MAIAPQTFWDCHEIYAELHRVAANSAINSISAVSQLRTICQQRKHSSVGWVAPDWSLQQLPISMVATVTRFWDAGKSLQSSDLSNSFDEVGAKEVELRK